jgi:N-methylhydantoinase A
VAHRTGTTKRSVRRAYFGPAFGWCDTPVVDRADLANGPVQGPVIVEEYDSTVVIPPGASAIADEHHNIVITL